MCLDIKSGPHVAKKDFYTLKFGYVFSSTFLQSYYQREIQKFNKLLTSKIIRINNISYKSVEEGLHSLICDDSTKNSEWATEWFDLAFAPIGIVVCKVPKGATYYIGKDNDVASNKLMLLELIAVNQISNVLDSEKTIHNKPCEQLKHVIPSCVSYVKSLGYNTIPS